MQIKESNGRYSVVLADDHIGIVQMVSRLLADEFDVVATVGDGATVVQAAISHSPDVVVLDICMPGLDGIQAAREIRRQGISSKLVILTVQKDPEYMEAARNLGASYVLKCHMHKDLVQALKEALAGRIFVSTARSA